MYYRFTYEVCTKHIATHTHTAPAPANEGRFAEIAEISTQKGTQ